MYGIYWKYLIFFGFIFWIALCIQDYNTNDNYSMELYNEISEDNYSKNSKGQPPCLTFWKTLSMVLSLSALVYIKRTSNLRKSLKSNFMLTSSYEEFNIEPLKNYTVNVCTELKTTQIVPDIYSNANAYGPKPIQGITGVELVQQKLDDLEKTVQNLKKRHISPTSTFSSPGIVSGSPEFRKFLSKLSPIESSQNSQIQNNNLLISSSELSIEVQIDGKLKNDDTNDDTKRVQSSQFDDNYEEIMEKSNIEKDISNAQDNSWSTISDAVTEFSDPKLGMASVNSDQKITSPIITEILQARNFTDVSKSSTDEKSINCLESVLNMITEHTEYDDDSEVPGSNLIPSENTSFSSRHQINIFPSLSSLDEDDLLLNTLD